MATYSDSGSRRSLSAMFDTKAEADRAISALEAAGIAEVVLTAGREGDGEAEVRDVRGDMTSRERGFFEQLGDFFFPDEDRYAYAEGLERGGYLVTIDNIPEHQYARALDILDDEGAIDLDAREAQWREEGWNYDAAPTGTAAAAGAGYVAGDYGSRDEGMPGTAAGRGVDRVAGALDTDGVDEGLPGTAVGRGIDRAAGGALDADLGRTDAALAGERSYDLEGGGTIDVAEERLHIAKRERDLGRVRVRSYVREIPVDESVSLREERVSIERRPVDRDATEADFREQSIEAREYAEEAVVSKDARVVEEVALRSETESREHEVHDTVRKTEIEVEDERDGTLNPDGTRRDPNRI